MEQDISSFLYGYNIAALLALCVAIITALSCRKVSDVLTSGGIVLVFLTAGWTLASNVVHPLYYLLPISLVVFGIFAITVAVLYPGYKNAREFRDWFADKEFVRTKLREFAQEIKRQAEFVISPDHDCDSERQNVVAISYSDTVRQRRSRLDELMRRFEDMHSVAKVNGLSFNSDWFTHLPHEEQAIRPKEDGEEASIPVSPDNIQ